MKWNKKARRKSMSRSFHWELWDIQMDIAVASDTHSCMVLPFALAIVWKQVLYTQFQKKKKKKNLGNFHFHWELFINVPRQLTEKKINWACTKISVVLNVHFCGVSCRGVYCVDYFWIEKTKTKSWIYVKWWLEDFNIP